MTSRTTIRTTFAAAAAVGLFAVPALAQPSGNNLPLQNAPPSERVVGQGASAAEAGGDTSLGRKLGLKSEPHRTHVRHHARHTSAATAGTTAPAPAAAPTTAPATTTAPAAAPAPAVPPATAPDTTSPSPQH
ncbi:MAG: hypothetical protein INR65_06170 [Gluconacetobacter diazotrophicus]|nr:hypothetical protein [Gluconacetobacter diazotrophicus]